jgi:hypothetical protein
VTVGASGDGGQLANDAVDLLVPRLQVVKHAAALLMMACNAVVSTTRSAVQEGELSNSKAKGTDKAALASG